MIPSKDNLEHEPSLIEDVVMPHTEKNTDPDRPVVRRRSIGNLQRQYQRRQKAKTAAPLDNSGLSRQHYTMVPPLRVLHSSSGPLPGFLGTALLSVLLALSAPVVMVRKLGSRLSSAGGWAGGAAAGGFSKKYSISSGVTDWRAAGRKVRFAIPVVLILFIIGLLAFGLWNGPSRQPGSSTNKPSTSITQVPVTPVTNVGGKSGAPGTGGGSGSAVQPQSPASGSSSIGAGSSSLGTTYSSGSSGSAGGLTGGMGAGPTGGGTTSGTSGSSGSSGSGSGGGTVITTSVIGTGATCTTTTCTVNGCTPPKTISYGQKAVLVGGVCVVDPVSL